MHPDSLALKRPRSSQQAQAFWERERPARSPDDPGLQADIRDLVDPLRGETFFRSAAYVWTVTLFGLFLVGLPFVFLIWRFLGVLSVLNQAVSGMTGTPGLP